MKENSIYKASRTTISVLEALLFAALMLMVIDGVIRVGDNVLSSLVHGEGLDKDSLQHLIDEVLLLVIVIDLMRTLSVAIVHEQMFIITAMEAAILAVIREFVSARIHGAGMTDFIGYSIALIVLFYTWRRMVSWLREYGMKYFEEVKE